MLVNVKVRYRYRFYPTPEQSRILTNVFGASRFVYNWALRQRTDAYQVGKRMNYNGSSAALTVLKKQPDYAWLNDVSSVPTQQSLRHLQTAFKNFFEKRSAYPSFKRKHDKQSAEYTRSAFTWNAMNKNLCVAQLGRLDIRWCRAFTSYPTTVTITKSPSGKYFVTLVLDESKDPFPKTGQSIGIDLGVLRLATLSNGETIPNPKHLNRYQTKLAHEQRNLSRKKKGSHRYEFQRVKIARLHERIANTRQDHLHKVTTDLVRRFDIICMEDLHVRGMVRNHHLARSLSDAALGEFSTMVGYKCQWYGKEQRLVDRFYPSSKRCNDCGHIVKELSLSVRSWVCPECGAIHDRDENASKNILAAGQAVTARRATIRPKRITVRKGKSR